MNCVGAVKLARKLGPGHTVATILCDGGQRYMHLLPVWACVFCCWREMHSSFRMIQDGIQAAYVEIHGLLLLSSGDWPIRWCGMASLLCHGCLFSAADPATNGH